MPRTKTTKKIKKPKSPKNTPIMPVKPRKKALPKTPTMIARSARIAAIRARTTAGLAELEALRQGADTSDLDHLPVMVPSGPRRANGWATMSPERRAELEDDGDDADETPTRAKQHDIYLPKTRRPCPTCKRADHPGITCRELSEWLVVADAVLAGELPSPEGWPGLQVDTAQLPPRKTGRPRKYTPDVEADARRAIRRDSAASSCPAPSPSP